MKHQGFLNFSQWPLTFLYIIPPRSRCVFSWWPAGVSTPPGWFSCDLLMPSWEEALTGFLRRPPGLKHGRRTEPSVWRRWGVAACAGGVGGLSCRSDHLRSSATAICELSQWGRPYFLQGRKESEAFASDSAVWSAGAARYLHGEALLNVDVRANGADRTLL